MSVTINGSAGVTTNSGAVYNGISSGTAVASTSGTSIDFTGIPSWVERITVMFNGVSTNGTSNLAIQLGDSGGIENTGYTGGAVTPSTQAAYNSASYLLTGVSAAAAAYNGIITLALISGNIWIESGAISASASGYQAYSGGSKELSATLDRIRITTANGTDTFDAGSVNILYE
jgi:hypothetical protein